MTKYAGRSIAIIEDDRDYTQLIVDQLEWQGFRFAIATNGAEGVRLVRAQMPDLVILDLWLTTKHEGLQVLDQLQADPLTCAIPVIIHSIRASEKLLRTNGLRLGAWYCLDKNDSLGELDAIVQRILYIQSSGHSRVAQRRRIPLDYDQRAGTVWIDGQVTAIRLSRYQGTLLATLVEHAGQICSRDMLGLRLYGSDAFSNEQIDRMVSRLRSKLGDDPDQPRFIMTVWGQGYKMLV